MAERASRIQKAVELRGRSKQLRGRSVAKRLIMDRVLSRHGVTEGADG